MKNLLVRNANHALSAGLQLMDQYGVERPSRNGPVKYAGHVVTVYERPWERVMFWPERDANPFFHLYESLWMLQGRNDLAPLLRYARNMANFSDDGLTLHGSYGYRWRFHFGYDQLRPIAETLRDKPDDRRCILQMWDATVDGHGQGKDYPCNTIASFQRGIAGELNLTVFCRSNDIIWGAYGANVVQFSMLLEYMAHWIGCPMGTYTQDSVNWHGYLDTLEKVNLIPRSYDLSYDGYAQNVVTPIPMAADCRDHRALDWSITEILEEADNGFPIGISPDRRVNAWSSMVYSVLRAHHEYKLGNIRGALTLLDDSHADWVVAGREWILRRL